MIILIINDSGEGITSFVPIFDGYSLSNSKLRMDLVGTSIIHKKCF